MNIAVDLSDLTIDAHRATRRCCNDHGGAQQASEGKAGDEPGGSSPRFNTRLILRRAVRIYFPAVTTGTVSNSSALASISRSALVAGA
jgi:hypothetical protein